MRLDSVVRGATALGLTLLVTGCPVTARERACSELRYDAATVDHHVHGAFLDIAVDYDHYDRHKPMLAEWRRLGQECELPIAEVKSIREAFDRAYEDKHYTKEEVQPLVDRMEVLVKAASGGSIVVAPTRTPVPTTVFGCPIPKAPESILELPMPLVQNELRGLPPHLMEERRSVEEASGTADANLQLLAQAQIAYHQKHGKYLAFAKADAKTLSTLGVTLPGRVHHTFTSYVSADGFRILAEGNLDKDPFLDRWLVEHKTASKDRCPAPSTLAADSVNLSFEGAGMAVIPAGKPQPRIKLP